MQSRALGFSFRGFVPTRLLAMSLRTSPADRETASATIGGRTDAGRRPASEQLRAPREIIISYMHRSTARLGD
jgi:hypothetical protein